MELVLILNYHATMTIRPFRKELLPTSDLYKDLTMYPCRTMDDVLNKASAHVKWKEDEVNR